MPCRLRRGACCEMPLIRAGVPLNIVILTESVSFPEGMAGTSRVRLYARGLIENGCSASTLIVRGTESHTNVRNIEIRGVADGIPFEYTSGNTTIPKSWALRRFDEVKGLLGAYIRLRQLKRRGALDCVLIYSNDIKFIRPFSRMCHRLGVPVVLDLCEWPLSKATAYGLNIKRARRFMHDAMRSVDGVIPISTFLQERIEEYEFDNDTAMSHLRIPILVDTSAFTPSVQADGEKMSFLWSGSLDYTRVVKCIADACRELSSKRTDFEVNILGGLGPKYQRKKLEAYIKKWELGDIVKVWDFLSYEDLVEMYRNATALMVLLVDDDISRSRFPTKLGEYLAVGRPVIATCMGELKNYLKDGETAFLVPDSSPEHLAQKMEEVMDNPQRTEEIGLAGRELAEQEFCYKKQGKRLRTFCLEVIASYGDGDRHTANAHDTSHEEN